MSIPIVSERGSPQRREPGDAPAPIEGRATDVAGFLGETERGPEAPTWIGSVYDYQHIYGNATDDSTLLDHVVRGYFDNGGLRCVIARVVAGGEGGGAGLATARVGPLVVSAIGRGAWGNRIGIAAETPADRPGRVRLHVFYHGAAQPLEPAGPAPTQGELFEIDEPVEGVEGVKALAAINDRSVLVRVGWDDAPGPIGPLALTTLSGGSDAESLTAADFEGVAPGTSIPGAPFDDLVYTQGTGLAGLAAREDVMQIVAPDQAVLGDDLTQRLIGHCESLGDRFAVLALGRGEQDPSVLNAPLDSAFGAMYWPWISINDPRGGATITVPPVGHIAGIYARTDTTRGVQAAPANEVIDGVLGLDISTNRLMQERLGMRGINLLRDFRPWGRGPLVWGASTMSSDREWKSIPVRRLMLFLERSIERGTRWAAFEPNEEPTWALVRRQIESFLLDHAWRTGALTGARPEDAFFVRCDRTTMNQDDIDAGRLVCLVGVAPVRPAEFVILRIGQGTAHTQ